MTASPTQPTTVDRIISMGAAADTAANMELGSVSTSFGVRMIAKAVQLSDCPVDMKEEWGPSISDMTLSINEKDVPAIRFSNYLQMTQLIATNNIIVHVGNEDPNATKLTSMTLENYLSNLNLSSNGKENSHENAVVSTQACLVPFSDEAPFLDIKFFNPYNFHYSNPKVLVIVASPHGTSTQIIVGNEQILRFNNFGRKAQFANVFGSSKDANFKIENNLNQLTIVQVPLRVSKIKPNDLPAHLMNQRDIDNSNENSSSWTNYLSLSSLWGSSDNSNNNNSNTNNDKSNKKANPHFIRYVPPLRPQCKCGEYLVQLVAQFCYGVNEESVTVSCDTCSESHSGNEIMWHCPCHKNKTHPDGFDVCNKCALAQCNFDLLLEGTGYEIIREVNLPIRVTYQYYFPISKSNPGKISNSLATAILGKLMSLQMTPGSQSPSVANKFRGTSLNENQMAKLQQMKQLRQQGKTIQQQQQQQQQQSEEQAQSSIASSEAKEETDNPFRSGFLNKLQSGKAAAAASAAATTTVISQNGIKDDYEAIREALKSINFGARNNVNYLKIFMANNVTDNDLEYLTNDDLTILFDKLGPRMRFRRWLGEYQKEVTKEKMKRQLFEISENGQINEERLNSNVQDYSTIISIFKKLNVDDWQVYMKNFIDNGVTDLMLGDIAERDISDLIPNMGAKMTFRKYLLQNRQSKRFF